MSALEQKLQEYKIQLQALKDNKVKIIEQKVEAFRQQLLRQENHADEMKLQAVIDALSKVIDYEKAGK